MSRAPFFKLFFSDLVGDTLSLSDAEFGSYMLLLGAMWNGGGHLPNNPARLARVARCSPKLWPRRWAALSGFFSEDGDTVSNARLLSERQKVESISAERSLSGKRGAEAKALKSLGLAQAKASANDKQPEPEPEDHSVKASVTLDQRAWREGVALLTANGRMQDKTARSFFGRLLRDHKLEPHQLLATITAAEVKGTADPQGYLKAAAKRIGQDKGGTTPLVLVETWDDDVWRTALDRYRSLGAWSETMGPPPEGPGCWAPPHVLAEWRDAA